MQDDVEAISALVYSYAEQWDAGDYDGVARLFAHGTMSSPGPDGQPRVSVRGSAAVRERYGRILHLYDGKPCTLHVTTNLVVEADEGRATASARSCFVMLQARPELPLQIICAGRYQDRFARIDGTWQFADRLVYTDLIGNLSYILKQDFLKELLAHTNR